MVFFRRSLIINDSVSGALGVVFQPEQRALVQWESAIMAYKEEFKQEALKGWKGKQALDIQIRFP